MAWALSFSCSGMNVPDAPYVLQLPNVLHLATDITGLPTRVWPPLGACRGTPSDRRGVRHLPTARDR